MEPTRRSARFQNLPRKDYSKENIDWGPILPSHEKESKTDGIDDNDGSMVLTGNASSEIESKTDDIADNDGSILLTGNVSSEIVSSPLGLAMIHQPIITNDNNINNNNTNHNNNTQELQAFRALKRHLWTVCFSQDTSYNNVDLAIHRERTRIFRQCLYDIGHQFFNTLNKEGTTNPARNKKSRPCDNIVFETVGVDYLESRSDLESRKNGNIQYFYNFGWQAAKEMFGGIDVISRPAEDGRDGFYHLDNVSEIAYSGNNKTLSIRYLVKWSSILETNDDEQGKYAQYGAH